MEPPVLSKSVRKRMAAQLPKEWRFAHWHCLCGKSRCTDRKLPPPLCECGAGLMQFVGACTGGVE